MRPNNIEQHRSTISAIQPLGFPWTFTGLASALHVKYLGNPPGYIADIFGELYIYHSFVRFSIISKVFLSKFFLKNISLTTNSLYFTYDSPCMLYNTAGRMNVSYTVRTRAEDPFVSPKPKELLTFFQDFVQVYNKERNFITVIWIWPGVTWVNNF